MKLWLMVDLDNKELPLAVADSAYELARMIDSRAWLIKDMIRKAAERGGRSKYMVIEVPEEEDGDI